MKRASIPIPKNEKTRLKVLWEYSVLDTIPEDLFDDLTELAAHICEAPIALITLVDEDRQWFKSKVGIGISETSRDISFCAHAIMEPELFIVSDASKDARFATNPLVITEPKMRFYAGAPLMTPDGYALGTLCVIDTIPRELRPQQKQALRILARHVAAQLELRRRSRELVNVRNERDHLEDDLKRARTELAKLQRKSQGSVTKTKGNRSRVSRHSRKK